MGGAATVGDEDRAAAAVPEALRPPPGNPRFPGFDGLRAMAALSVLVFHAGFYYAINGRFGRWETNLNAGVTVFFVISGFLLYRPFVAADMDGRRAPVARRYFRRRVLRIVPAYWVALTLLSLYPFSQAMFGVWPKHYLFLQIYSPVQGGIGQAWSLAVEASFYVVLPLYALGMRRLFGGRTPHGRLRVELWVLGAIALLSLAARIAYGEGHLHYLLAGLPQFAMWFVVGMALAALSAWSRHVDTPPRLIRAVAARPGACWAAAALVFVLLGALTQVPRDGLVVNERTQLVQWVLSAVIAGLLVLPAVFAAPGAGLPGRFLARRWVMWLGLISYGIFLWQVAPLQIATQQQWVQGSSPTLVLLQRVVIALAFTIPVAALSYYVVERPFLRLKERRPEPHAVPAAAPAARPSPVWLISLSLVALACGVYAYARVSGSGFFADDFRNLGLASDRGLGWSLLVEPLAGRHLAPGHRLLDWLITALPGAPDPQVAAAVSCVLLAAAVVLLGRLVRAVTDAPWVALGVAAVFGTSVVWVRVAMWWTDAAHALPATVLILGMLLLALRWDRTRSGLVQAAVMVLFLLALAFSARAVVGGLLALILLTVARPSTRAFSWGTFRTRVLDTLELTRALLAVAFVWGVFLLADPGSAHEPAARAGDWFPLLRAWWSAGLGDVVLNVRPRYADPQAWALAGVGAIVAVAVATARGSRAALLWGSFVVTVVVGALLVGAERLGDFGPLVATELRYHPFDLVALAVLGPSAWAVSGRPRPRTTLQRVTVIVAAAAFAGVWVVQGAASADRIERTEPAVAARAWLDRLDASLQAQPGAVTVLDDHAPETVSSSTLFPYSELSRIVPLFAPRAGVRFDALAGRVLLVGPDGLARPPLLGPPRVLRPFTGVCLRSAVGTRFLSPGLPVVSATLPRSPGRRMLEVRTARTVRGGTLALYGRPRATGYPKEITVPAGSGGVRSLLPSGVAGVTLQAWGGLSTCITGATVRTVAADPGPGRR